MHKFRRSPISIDDNLDSVRKGLHEEQRFFLDAEKDSLRNAFKSYDAHASTDPVSLEKLQPLWIDLPADTTDQKSCKKEKRDRSFSLYGSSRPFVNSHWEFLKKVNGGGVLMCPICGLEECTEMDHYMPRSIFHEYASHVGNLIPLCHDCNIDKHNYWLDSHGNRYFFNAFYDKLPAHIIECSISMFMGLPKVTLKISPSLDKGVYSDAVVLRTIHKLGLMSRFQIRADDIFRNEIVRLRADYSVQKANYKNDRKAFWNARAELFKTYVSLTEGFSFLHKEIYNAMANSADMEGWVVNSRDFCAS